MNTIVFNKLSNQVLFEEKAKEVERSSRNYLEVIDGQHADLLAGNTAIKDSSAIRHRRAGYVFYEVFIKSSSHTIACGMASEMDENAVGLKMTGKTVMLVERECLFWVVVSEA